MTGQAARVDFRLSLFRVTALTGVVVLAASAWFSSPLLGFWESFIVYGAFGALDLSPVFRIHQTANLAGQGYALLEAARPLADLFGWSLGAVRLPAVLLGWAALVAFWTVARRWFGAWPALGATLLLALNPVFFVYQHELLVTIVTFLGLLLALERLQVLTRSWRSVSGWAGLGLVYAFLVLHYGPGRIQGTAIIGAAIGLGAWEAWRRGGLAAFVRSLARGLALFFAAFLGALLLLDPDNFHLMAPGSMLFPAGSEYTLDSGDILQTILRNLRVEVESLFRLGDGYHSGSCYDLMTELRYPLTPLILLPFLAAGMAVAAVAALRPPTARRGGDRPWLMLHGLFVLFAGPPLLSHLYPAQDDPTALMTTLSDYRLFNILIPLHLYAAAALRAALAVRQAAVVPVVAVAVLAAVGVEGGQLRAEHRRFTAAVERVATDPALAALPDGEAMLAFRNDRFPRGHMIRHYEHFNQHAQYLRVIGRVRAALPPLTATDAVIVPVDIRELSQAPFVPWGLGLSYLQARNYHVLFLALYAADLGLDAGFVQLPKVKRLSGYWGARERIYSAELALDGDGRPVYREAADGPPVLRRAGRAAPRIVFTLTPEERRAARTLLEAAGFQVRELPAAR